MISSIVHSGAGVSLTYNYIWIIIGVATLIGFGVTAKRWAVVWLDRLIGQGVETNQKLAKQNKKAKADRKIIAKIVYELGDNGGKSLKDAVSRTEAAFLSHDKTLQNVSLRLKNIEDHIVKDKNGQPIDSTSS